MRFYLVIALFWACTGVLNASYNEAPGSKQLNVTAIRLAEPVHLDGILAEKVWQNGHGVTKFKQREPIEDAEPSMKTEVRVAYNDEAIYVGARMYDSAPDSIIARLGRRDSQLSSDRFIFFIDPYYDKRSGYYFSINAGGTLDDGVLMNDEWDDDSWDGVWEGSVNIDELGWTAEMKIPYSQIRFQKKERYLWGVNFKRIIERKNELDYIVFTPKNGNGFVSRFVDLKGIENISPARHVAVLPYIRTKAEFIHPEAGDPFNDGSRYLPSVGADMKIGIGNNLTLDATINPDFGQVEVDPAVVNLSDVETFYDEKRPFFIEGASIFDFGYGGARSYWSFNWSSPDFFYSRRVGRSPQRELPDNDFTDVPDGTKILGAAKLTGKVGNNWNIGTMHAITAKETAEYQYEGEKEKIEVEPLSYYGVFRGQKEFNKGARGLGMISTVTSRKFSDEPLKDELNKNAYALGIDGWTFLDNTKTWVFTGWIGMSRVHANQNCMIDLQRSSRHYFQRPDANHVDVDSSATSMTGYAGRFYLNKQKGNFFVNSALGFITPGFDVNDTGFMWRGDVVNGHFGWGYQWTKPTTYYRELEIIGAVFRSYDFDKNINWQGVFGLINIDFLNYYELEVNGAYNPQTMSNRRTRGGPLTINKPGWELNVFINTDRRKPWVFGFGTYGYNSSSGDWNRGIELEVEWKPSSNLSITISPEYEYEHETSQWVDSFEDPFASNTYGNRYVFANLIRRSLSSSIRVNWTFSPSLSLQIYAQPLLSSGDYYQYKELARPRSYDFINYEDTAGMITLDDDEYELDPDGTGPAESFTFENPDFNFKSLRGNAVLRWEYSPGSVLYFVWTQSRSESEDIGSFRLHRSLGRLWQTDVDNIFMIKMSYWWSL